MKNRVNLLDIMPQKHKVSFSFREMLRVMGLIIIVCVIISAYYSFQQKRYQRKIDSVRAAQNVIQNEISIITKRSPKKVEEQQALAKKISDLQQEIAMREKMLSSLSQTQIGSTKGFSSYLEAFSRDIIPNVWLQEFNLSDGGGQISIAGKALRTRDVLQFMTNLYRDKTFGGRLWKLNEVTSPGGESTEGHRVELSFSMNLQAS